MNDNIILLTDSYKQSHWLQYPPGTREIYSYFETRTDGEEIVFFGLQYLLKRYLAGQVVTLEKINEAEELCLEHFGRPLFNSAGWEHILSDHGGQLPLEIKAAPEGMVVPSHNVLFTVRNTCPKCFWLTNFVETLLVETWYPLTVASLGRRIKKMLKKAFEETGGDMAKLPFMLHDFGVRGVSSPESAAWGGAAHLVNFLGTDNLPALTLLRDYYGSKTAAGFSIPAGEHSTITTWGRDGEGAAFENMLKQYPEGLVAAPVDSYDTEYATKVLLGEELHGMIMGRKGTFIGRPDSGELPGSPIAVLDQFGKSFGRTKGDYYRKLPPQVAVIQGDGVNEQSIGEILKAMKIALWSADQLAYGMGGALLQKLDRDTHKIAMKCSSVVKDLPSDISPVGETTHARFDVWKQPVGDPSKASKRGILGLYKNGTKLITLNEDEMHRQGFDPEDNILQTVYLDGEVKIDHNLIDIRQRSEV